MNSSSSSSLFDASLHEDIDDLLFPGLDFDDETLDIADEFMKDLKSTSPSSPDDESIDNHNNCNINYDHNINSDDSITDFVHNQPQSPEYHDFHPTHTPNFLTSSPFSIPLNLDIPLSPLNNDYQPPQSINVNSHVPSHSSPSNLAIPLTPLHNQSQQSQPLSQDPNPIHPQSIQSQSECNTPIVSLSQSHYAHPDPSPCNNDTLDAYWESSGCASEFFNFDQGNNTDTGPVVSATPAVTSTVLPSPVVNIYAPVKANSTSQHKADDSLRPSKSAERGQYKQVKKGQSSQRGRFFPSILPIDNSHKTLQNGGTYQNWFFVLRLLVDVSHKSVVAWTGHQRFFKVIDKNALCTLWAKHTGNDANIGNMEAKWETFKRNMRLCGGKGILMPVPSKTHKGMNAERLYGFMIEPSYYVGMTREKLDRFIVENCQTAPLPPQDVAPSTSSTPVMHNHQQHQYQHHHQQQFPLEQQYPNIQPQMAQPMNETAPLQQSQALAPSTSSAAVLQHQPLQSLQQQAPLYPQYPHIQPHMALPVNEFPYYPNFDYYQQQPPVMHAQIQPMNYRYSPY